LRLAVAREGEAGGEQKRRGAQSENEGKRKGGSSAKRRGKGLALPSPWIYRSKRATLPIARAVRINCKRLRLPLMGRPHYAEMARHASARYHYGATTEGPRRPVTSAPHVAHNVCGCALEKAPPQRTTATTTVGI
jgi:hypothetical protein